jgi:chemotaxis protein CheC
MTTPATSSTDSYANPYFNKVTSQKEYQLDQKVAQEIKITGEDLDVFRELGNMGAGNAGNALSQILNKKVFLEIPPAKVLNLNELGEKFSDASKKMIGLIGTTQGFFTSNIFLYFETEHVENLLQDLLSSKTKKKLTKESDLDDKEKSAIQEISSILMSHYVAAISNFIQKKIEPPEYQFFFKNIKVLLNDLIKSSKDQELRAIIVETNLKVEENIDIKGEFILVLTPDIVHQIKERILEVW